jgi:hypothetical protein
MKKTFFMVLILSLVLSVSAADKLFDENSSFISPVVGLNSYTIPFGLSYEKGITENIGIGGTVMVWLWSGASIIAPQVEGMYHFDLDVDKLDVFAGAGLAYYIFSAGDGIVGAGGLSIPLFAGARYYVSEKMAVLVRLNFSALGDWGGVGAIAGVSFKLK